MPSVGAVPDVAGGREDGEKRSSISTVTHTFSYSSRFSTNMTGFSADVRTGQEPGRTTYRRGITRSQVTCTRSAADVRRRRDDHRRLRGCSGHNVWRAGRTAKSGAVFCSAEQRRHCRLRLYAASFATQFVRLICCTIAPLMHPAYPLLCHTCFHPHLPTIPADGGGVWNRTGDCGITCGYHRCLDISVSCAMFPCVVYRGLCWHGMSSGGREKAWQLFSSVWHGRYVARRRHLPRR